MINYKKLLNKNDPIDKLILKSNLKVGVVEIRGGEMEKEELYEKEKRQSLDKNRGGISEK